MSHYFTNDNKEKREYLTYINIENTDFKFMTSDGVFSKNGVDKGSLYLINAILNDLEKGTTGLITDIGCGFGAIGITLARLRMGLFVYMTDINEKACQLAEKNIALNGLSGRVHVRTSDIFSGLPKDIDYVVTNPPFRAGKAVVHQFFSESLLSLKPKGCLYAVLRKQQGAESYMKTIESIFGNCTSILKKKGYIVIKAYKTVDSPYA